jgi:DNA polymerase epsilon subunit 3
METSLPTAAVLRVVKEELPDGTLVSSDAKAAFARAGAIFALYLASAADAVRAESSKRAAVTAGDIFRALEDVELPEFAAALQRDMQGA